MAARDIDDANAASCQSAPAKRTAISAGDTAVGGPEQRNGTRIGTWPVVMHGALDRGPHRTLVRFERERHARRLLPMAEPFRSSRQPAPQIGCALRRRQATHAVELVADAIKQAPPPAIGRLGIRLQDCEQRHLLARTLQLLRDLEGYVGTGGVPPDQKWPVRLHPENLTDISGC